MDGNKKRSTPRSPSLPLPNQVTEAHKTTDEVPHTKNDKEQEIDDDDTAIEIPEHIYLYLLNKERKKVFPDAGVSFVARSLTKREEEWKWLGYALGFLPEDIAGIVAQSSGHPYALAHLMLLKWRCQCPPHMMADELRRAFIRTRRRDLCFMQKLGYITQSPEDPVNLYWTTDNDKRHWYGHETEHRLILQQRSAPTRYVNQRQKLYQRSGQILSTTYTPSLHANRVASASKFRDIEAHRTPSGFVSREYPIHDGCRDPTRPDGGTSATAHTRARHRDVAEVGSRYRNIDAYRVPSGWVSRDYPIHESCIDATGVNVSYVRHPPTASTPIRQKTPPVASAFQGEFLA